MEEEPPRCPVHHMSIREALQCGCAHAQHREMWDIDVIRHPPLFEQTDALAAYMSNCVTNCVRHAVCMGEVETARINTPYGSVRCMSHMAMAMGHKSDTHVCLAVRVGETLAEASRHMLGYGNCVTGQRRFKSENKVSMVEKPRCQVSNHKSEVPHPRFPAERKGTTVQFNNNRAIHPKCGSLVEALAVTVHQNESELVPLGYNPRRWQGVVEAHLKFKRALMMDRVTDSSAWPDHVEMAMQTVISKHRPRGVCINRTELRIMLQEMADHLRPDAPDVPEDVLREICVKYSVDAPLRHNVPSPLYNVMQGSMRDRRKILSHWRITRTAPDQRVSV